MKNIKTGHLFWGILFITFGGLFLLDNFTSVKMNWDFIWSLWPIILIILGSYFLIRQTNYRWILVILNGLLLGVLLFAAIKNISGYSSEDFEDDSDNYNYNVEYFHKEFNDKINSVNLYVQAGAGRFELNDTTNLLFDAVAKGNYGNYYFNTDSTDSNYDLSLEMENEHHHFSFGRFNKNNVDIKLNTKPKWDLKFDVGASSVNLDLSPYIVQSLNIKSGAAKVKIKLGDRSDFTKVNVHSGVSNLEISIPKATGCQINAETALSKKNFFEFEKIDKNTYQTSNFNNAPNKAVIDLNVAVSSIRVSRY